jgi:hypothetical protein
MAFRPENLFRVASFGANALHVYIDRDNDGAATIDTSGHMNAAFEQLKTGDVILRISASAFSATLGTITTVGTAGWHVVVSNASGVVDLSDTLALTITDTD